MNFTYLEKRKVIDAQPGFVDSWNRMVDCWNNISGSGMAKVSWNDDFHPTIDVQEKEEDDEEDDNEDYEPSIVDLVLPPFDPCGPVTKKPSTFEILYTNGLPSGFSNRYYMVGAKTYEAGQPSQNVLSGIVVLKVLLTGESPSASYASVGSIQALQTLQNDTDYAVFPLYQFGQGGNVVCDLRNIPVIPAGEF